MKQIIASLLFIYPMVAHSAEFDQIYTGKYVWGHEVHSFAPCNSDKAYWVSFNWAGTKMHEFYKAEQKEPYQFMYIKFRGHVLDEKVDGFAEQYDGLIRISEVKNFTFDIPSECK